MRKLSIIDFFVLPFVVGAFAFTSVVGTVLASETNGTIDTTYKNAWGENIGWINFGCDNCNVAITDSGLTGHAWSSQFGWINLDPDNSGVANTSAGVLSGFAWGSNIGWIDFDGVTINSSGEFVGYATVESNSSQISFNCVNGGSCSSADFKLKTDWRPANARSSGISSGSAPGSQTAPSPSLFPPLLSGPIAGIVDNISGVVDSIFGFLKPGAKPDGDTFVQVPITESFSFMGWWNLLPAKAINAFVFAPLPYEVRSLAAKFPELDQTLKSLDINRFTDMTKLGSVTLNLPGLTELANTLKNIGSERLADLDQLDSVNFDLPGLSNLDGKLSGGVGTGNIALIPGLPVTNFPLLAKKNLPAEFVFARVGQELIDLDVALSIGSKGEVIQQIATLPSQTMRLVVKPISPAKSVTGYFVFKSATPRVVQNEVLRSSLVASSLFSLNSFVEQDPEPIAVENKLVLFSFEYEDPDGDGIYTADVVSPVVPGEYEIVTIIAYIDPVLGTRQMRMITVIDPEGYVFEKRDGKETRIPSAVVSLYSLNTATKKYELWNAKEYSQENPQITDIRGTYSFLVPEGSYYFEVEAPGYHPFQGKVFVVTEGSGVHQNIELKSGRGWLEDIDWTVLLLVVVILLLVYNLYRNSLRNKLSKFLNKNDGK